MPSPFPGMNPYLENPDLWSEVHSRLIVAIADAIAPNLHPQYYVAIEKRTYLSDIEDSVLVGIPDVALVSKLQLTNQQISTVTLPAQTEAISVTVPQPEEVQERYLEIREVGTNTVVTVVEIISPKNKRAGVGREAYERKRKQVLASLTNLVEIDLLRSGKSMRIIENIKSDYRILISRVNSRPKASLYAFSVRDEIPSFFLPLHSSEGEPLVELQSLLNGIYERAGYELRIDYTQPSQPPLKAEDAVWASELLRSHSLGGQIEGCDR